MAVSLRLSRGGSKQRPYYRIVVADSRAPRDGKNLEQVGTYNPMLAKEDPVRVRLNEDRIRYWLGVGAQPTDRVARFLDVAGIRERAAKLNPKKGEPGEAAKNRAEDKISKAAAAEEAAAAAVEEAKEAAAAAAAAPVVEEVVAEEAPTAEETPVIEEAAVAEEAPAAEEPAAEAPAEEAAAEEPAAE